MVSRYCIVRIARNSLVGKFKSEGLLLKVTACKGQWQRFYLWILMTAFDPWTTPLVWTGGPIFIQIFFNMYYTVCGWLNPWMQEIWIWRAHCGTWVSGDFSVLPRSWNQSHMGQERTVLVSRSIFVTPSSDGWWRRAALSNTVATIHTATEIKNKFN